MKETPIRQQYLRIKRRYPQAIVLFRLGDFYETFDEDAKITSKELEIVLTSREMGKGYKVPMAGIPYHAINNYLAKLINRGYKVAICEQTTKPGETKGIVQRDVIRVVTPGTIIEPGLLESKSNNYLASIFIEEGSAGLTYVDITTSEFATTQLPIKRLIPELQRLKPSELVIPESLENTTFNAAVTTTNLDDYYFEFDVARESLLAHFSVSSLDGFGCSGLPLAIRSAGAIIHYLQETQKGILSQLTRLSTYSTESYMELDTQTQRNLELFQNSRSSSVNGSLLSTIDLTRTAMGGRLIKRWLGQPLLDIVEIKKRQDYIQSFFENSLSRTQTFSLLAGIADLERIINRIKNNIAIPRELVALRRSMEIIPKLKEVVIQENLSAELKTNPEIISLILKAIEEEPSSNPGEGGVIRTGFSDELDNLRSSSKNARQYLANLEKQEREKTGIKSLKVGYNRVFGYYIEVSQSNLPQVPPQYIRKQTLLNCERFITPELKDYEALILNAEDRINELETQLFHQVCQQVASFSEQIVNLATTISNIDVLSSLAEIAVQNNYVKPEFDSGDEIIIYDGRHPVVEKTVQSGCFVANDTSLSNKNSQLIILTGPNMAGKSTYLRQVALIVLLAQIGSFVPAKNAKIGLVDRIFTRIGAGEDIATGQSTFMVEMVETANILNNATPRSLIILDEIGRGTSTYDGLSIARAVVEYIHNHPKLGSKTLFATHYHELVEMANYLPRVKNMNVAVIEEHGKVIFLYKVAPGGVDKSYGIHVAQLAGLPKSVIHRANEVLIELETDNRKGSNYTTKNQPKELLQIPFPFLSVKSPVLEELEKLDINSLTPLEALTKLYELQKQLQ